MTNISTFTLNANQDVLKITLQDCQPEQNNTLLLRCEYLRIFSPKECQKAQASKQPHTSNIPQVFHKKLVKLSHIEPLGKHGHRLIFNDGFNDIYSTKYLLELAEHFDTNWALYLETLTSNNSREESINFKAVT